MHRNGLRTLFSPLARMISAALLASFFVFVPAESSNASPADPEVDQAIILGEGRFLRSTTNINFDSDGPFSAEAWVHPEASTLEHAHIFDLATDRELYMKLRLPSPGALTRDLYVYDGSGGSHLPCGSVPIGQWSHVAMTHNGTSGYKCFVNGVYSGALPGNANFVEMIQIGKFSYAIDNIGTSFPGKIDQAKIWSKELTSAEISASMHTWGIPTTDLNGNPLSLSGQLRHHFDFNDNNGSVVKDKAGSSDLSVTGSVNFQSIATTTTSNEGTLVVFPRSYLTSNNGWKVPGGVTSATALVVAGGGGGGAWVGGGGGAGGFKEGNVVLTPGSNIPVQVGQGGAGAYFKDEDVFFGGDGYTSRSNTNGQQSKLGSLVIPGGGAGANHGFSLAQAGGSGGGGGISIGGSDLSPGGAAVVNGSFGFSGGKGADGISIDSGQPHATGGGGGAGGAGQGAVSATQSGAGGAGKETTLITSAQAAALQVGEVVGGKVYFAGGGGGSLHGNGFATAYVAAAGGIGGGGAGSVSNTAGYEMFQGGGAGDPNTGGGGGGAANHIDKESLGGAGGSGVVILSYDGLPYPTITSINAGIASLTVSWTAPTQTPGPITGYSVQWAEETTASTSPSWNGLPSPVSAAATSHTITGLDPAKQYHVRVAAVTSAGVGPYGYLWTKIFESVTPSRNSSDQIVYTSNFGLTGNNTDLSRTDFTHVRYRLEATYGGNDWYADTSFSRVISNQVATTETYDSLSRLQVPTLPGGSGENFEIQGIVQDATILSNSPLVQSGSGLTGVLEIWPGNYGKDAAAELKSAFNFSNDNAYDFADSFSVANNDNDSSHGSFQFHTLGASSGETVFAWNHHRKNLTPAIGFGNQPQTSHFNWNPDWTFASDAEAGEYPARTNFKFQSFANLSQQPLDDYSISFAGSESAAARAGSVANPVFVIPEDSSYTWEAWIKPESRWTSGRSFQTILDNAEEGNNLGRAWLYLIDDGPGPFLSGGYFSDPQGVGLNPSSSAGTLEYGKWQHVAMSVDRGAAAGSCSTAGTLSLRLYVNGVQVSQASNAFSGCLNSAGISVGANGDNVTVGDDTQYFRGAIDQVKVWDGALSQSQIQNSLQSFGAGSVGNTLRAHYSFNDLSSSPTSGNTIANLAPSGAVYDLSLYSKTTAHVATNISRSANSFTLSYSGNTADSGSVSSLSGIRPYANISLSPPGNLAKANFSFGNWDTKSDGTGTEYSPNDSLVYTYGDQTLFAEWERSSYNVTYLPGSNGTGANQSSLKLVGQNLILADESTANSWFDRDGYKVVGWSTGDDSTAEFGLAGTYSAEADLTLYPVWGVDRITVSGDTFVDNGDKGTPKGSLGSINLKNGPSLGTVTRYGYLEFDYDPAVSWNNSILELTVVTNNGGGACDPNPNAVACLWNKEYTSFQVEIYGVNDASWDEGTLNWNLASDSNLGWGLNTASFPYSPKSASLLGSIDIPTNSASIGQKFALSSSALDEFLDDDADGNVSFFMRRLDLDGNGNLEFASLQNADANKRPVLRLSSQSETYSISYNINGGTGQLPLPGQYTNGGAAYQIADPVSVTPPTGQEFLRWDTDPNGNGTSYDPGDNYSTPRTLTLYAIFGVVQQTVTPTIAYSNTPYSPSGTVSPTINNSSHDGTRTFSTSTQSVCSVNSSTGVATILTAGTCTVTVNFAETPNYAAATATASFVISKAIQQALAWDQSKISYNYLGSIDLSSVISGGSGTGTVTFADNNVANGCRVSGNVLSGGNAGTTCTITVTKGADTNYNAATLTQSITINKINQSALSVVNPGSQVFGQTVQLTSTGGSGTGAVTFNTASSSICTERSEGEFEFIGVGDCVVTIEKAADTNYNLATGTLTIAVAKADHTLSFTSTVPANPVTNGTYTVSGISSTGEASLAPSFRIASGSASICSIAGTTVTFNLDGACEIEAYKDATTNYNAAPVVTQRIVVGQANQSITFASLPNKTFGDQAFIVSATSSANNPVTFTRGSGTTNSSCSVTSAGLVVIAAVGSCEIVANSASANGFAAASPVPRTFEIAADTAGAPFITAVSFGDGSLTATYFAPGYLGGGTVSGYELTAYNSSNALVATQSSCAISGTLSCTVTGLENGTSYYLKIAAITEAGLGALSPASTSKIPAANPAAVSNLTAIQGDTTLTITWQAPVSLGGGTFDSYRIFHKEAGGSYTTYEAMTAAQATAATTAGVTTFVITGLTNGQAYDVKVVTVTTANTAELTSNTAEVTQTPYTVPDAPPTVTVLEVDDDIVITWSVPLFDGGSAISDYRVLLDNVPATCAATSATSCSIPKSSLTPGTTVAIEVKAENDAGLSAPASTSFQVASIQTPGTTLPGAPVVDQGPAAGIEAVSGQSWAWTKRISAKEVKVYIKFPEMGANYQIMLQKNDGEFSRKMSKTINTTADTDLRVVGDAYYLVRTITLPGEGRYRIEVTQDGQRTMLNGKDRPVVYTYR